MEHKCYRCGTEFDGTFCPECGTKWEAEKKCPHCGATVSGSAKFCNDCGYSFLGDMKPATAGTARSDKNDSASILRKLYRLLPMLTALIFTGISLVLFLFYLAPVMVTPAMLGEPSESLGNVYQCLKGVSLSFGALGSVEGSDPALRGAMIALIVFAVAMTLYGIFWTCSARTRDPLVFGTVGGLFCLALLILSAVVMGQVNAEGEGLIVAGAAPKLVLSFSVIDLVLNASAVIAYVIIPKYLPAEAPAERYEAAEPDKPADAAHTLTPPRKVAEPVKPVRPRANYRDTVPEARRGELMPWIRVYAQDKKKWTYLPLLFLAIVFLVFSVNAIVTAWRLNQSDFDIQWRPSYAAVMTFIVISAVFYAASCVYLCVRLYRNAQNCSVLSREWHPEEVYNNGLSTAVFALFIAVAVWCIFACMVAFLAAFGGHNEFPLTIYYLCSFFSYIPFLYALQYIADLGYIAFAFVILFFILTIVCIAKRSKLAKRRKALCVKLCGRNHPKLVNALEKDYIQQVKELPVRQKVYEAAMDAYRKERRAYREYCRKMTVYRYQKLRMRRGKYGATSYPAAWCYFHRIALSASAVGLAAVITLVCIFTIGKEVRYSVGDLNKIGLGAEEQKVIAVLGEPDSKLGTVWYYYSGDCLSILGKIEALDEKAMNATSEQDLMKYAEEEEALEKKLEDLRYQTVEITFSEGKVFSMTLNAATKGVCSSDGMMALPEEKEAAGCSISPQSVSRGETAEVIYTIEYADGSYATGYLSQALLPPTDTAGEFTVTWRNVWGSYEASFTVR